MTLVVDDPALPMAWYLNAALAYLFVLAAAGYMAVLAFIRAHADRAQWPQRLTNVVVGLYATLGIATIALVPASLLHRLKLQGATSSVGGIVFGTTIALFICIGLLIARRWYGFRPRKDNPTR
jgi:hypothetical protein